VPLDIIHRDVSPQNILIARDGVARVLDFGVAKALAQSPNTQSGLLKGKFGYMAPEQIMRGQVDRRADVFAAGVVLWETLTCRRLFQASKNIEQAMSRVISAEIPPPSTFRPTIPRALDAIVLKAMDRDADRRFQTAEELAVALEEDVAVASPHLVKTWFGPLASPELVQRAELIRIINKRYGTPGRSTPHPNALAEEARAALAAAEADGHQRRSWRTDSGLIPTRSQSGRYPIEPTLKPVTRTLPPRRTGTRLAGSAQLDGMAPRGGPLSELDTAGAEWQGPFEACVSWLSEHGLLSERSWLSGRSAAGALLIVVGLMSTWIAAVGWDAPPTSELLRARRAAHAQLEAATSSLYPSAPAPANRLNHALPELREGGGSSGSPRRPSDEASPPPRAKPGDRQSAPAAGSGLNLRLSR
jgi:hypothetical protein